MTFGRDPNQFLDEGAPALVQAYFREDNGAPAFSGSWFERLCADGSDENRCAPADIVAVTLLSVQVPAHAAIQILGPKSDEISKLLTQIPPNQDLWECHEATIAPSSAANQLWALFASLDGVGWVTAGKLCARKRPRLLPVYDNVVKGALELPKGESFWATLRTCLLTRPDVVGRLDEIRRTTPGVPADLPLLRVLDIAIWMCEHGKDWEREAP